MMNADYLLIRHSGAGRNPAVKIFREADKNSVLSRYAGCVFNQLDSGLRRNDGA